MNYKEIWGRVGITFRLTPAEERALLSGQEDGGKIILEVIAQGRYRYDGDGYIPAECVREFNLRHRTDYAEEEIDISI